MEGEVSTCEICSEDFLSGERDPLALPCGHTFCRKCLITVKGMNKVLTCPTCRRDMEGVVIESLPIIYKLFNSSSTRTKSQFTMCQSHSDKLTYWCQTCERALCGLCLFQGHPQNHEVVKAKISLEEKKCLLKQSIAAWQSEVEEEHKVTLQTAKKELAKFCQSKSQMSRSKKIIEELLPEIDEADKMETILDVETKIKSLKIVSETLFNDSKTNVERKGRQEQTNENDELESSETDKLEKFCGFVESADGSRASVEWVDGKLLLSAFTSEPLHGDLIFKMPSQVFLQLQTGDQYLGQVIIQPFYHLRRGQQFSALCQGTLGVSYLGSSFTCVKNRNCQREYLSGGWYLNPRDGTLTIRDLITGLEWDSGEATGACCTGAVLAVGYGAGESGFGICTRAQPGGTFKCVFGQVVSGIDVVKAAVRHNPVTDVIIKKCGVIVPSIWS